METRTFGDKKIKIREINRNDLKIIKEFRNFMNSLVDDNAKVSIIEKVDMKKEKEWMLNGLKLVKNKKAVCLVAEHGGKIVGYSDIKQRKGRWNHVGSFGISIRNSYRGIGLGECLAKEAIDLTKKRFKPAPQFIRLEVMSNNEPAQGLYKKLGFKKVASIPDQLQYNGKLIDEVVMLLKV